MKTKYSNASGAGGRKIPKTLSGIETTGTDLQLIQHIARKIPKTLSGIETICPICDRIGGDAGKYLKPYQGLKLHQ